jgi:replication-associated recombination protein RarA
MPQVAQLIPTAQLCLVFTYFTWRKNMMITYPQPISPNDFALKVDTRLRLHNVLERITPVPANGVCGIILYGLYGSGKTAMSKLLPGWIETAKTTQVTDVGLITDEHDANYAYHFCRIGNNSTTLLDKIEYSCSFVSFNKSNLHYVILDEVDNLTPAALSSLKAIMNFKHVVFIMTSNHLNKIDAGVINRSIVLDMNAAPTSIWVSKIQTDLASLGISNITSAAIEGVVNAGKGSCRTILTDISAVIARK